MIEMFMEGDRPIIFLSQIIQSKKNLFQILQLTCPQEIGINAMKWFGQPLQPLPSLKTLM